MTHHEMMFPTLRCRTLKLVASLRDMIEQFQIPSESSGTGMDILKLKPIEILSCASSWPRLYTF